MTEGALTHQNFCFEAQRRVNRAALDFLLNKTHHWGDVESMQHPIESYIADAHQKNSEHVLRTIHNKLSLGCTHPTLANTAKVIFAKIRQQLEDLRPELIPQQPILAASPPGA